MIDQTASEKGENQKGRQGGNERKSKGEEKRDAGTKNTSSVGRRGGDLIHHVRKQLFGRLHDHEARVEALRVAQHRTEALAAKHVVDALEHNRVGVQVSNCTVRGPYQRVGPVEDAGEEK